MKQWKHLAAGAALAALAGCGDRAGSGSGISVAIDSTADTVSVVVSGEVPVEEVRGLAMEMIIAPGIDDTTLFTSTYEFDVDRAGRIWVFDRTSASIFVFDSSGELVRRVGRRGAGPGEFAQNGGMVILPGDSLAQWDSNNARISFFDSAGTFVKQWSLPGGFSTSNGLYTDASGNLYLRRPVTPPREGEILGRMGLVRLREGGAFGDSLAPPDLPVPREPYVASAENSRSSMSSSLAPGYHWAWTPRGEFIAADGGRYELVYVRNGARPMVIRRAMAPVTAHQAERDLDREIITASLRQVDPSWSFGGPPIPEAKAPLQGLKVTRDGRIWVQVAVPSELIPEAQRDIPWDSTIPVRQYRTPPVYEVFERDGRFLGRVALPSRATLIEADGDLIWGLEPDDDDLPQVIRWRIEPGLGSGTH